MPLSRLFATAVTTATLTMPGLAGPSFVAGDVLGMELHAMAVLTLATPEADVLSIEAPTVLAQTQAPSQSQTVTTPTTWDVFERVLCWYETECQPNGFMMAIVH